jgi:FMN reductase
MIVVLSGNARPHSRTLHLAGRVGVVLAQRLGQPAPETIDVAELGSRLLVAGHVDVLGAVDRLRSASLLVVATPTYKGSYTGVLKVLLDGLPRPGLAGVAAVTVVTANEPTQAAATERHLRGLLGELGAVVVEPGLVALERQLERSHELAVDYAARVGPQLSSDPQLSVGART